MCLCGVCVRTERERERMCEREREENVSGVWRCCVLHKTNCCVLGEK